METTNNYCVWSFISGTLQPSVFRYNQTKEDGEKLVEYFLKENNRVYYCTPQNYGKYGECIGVLPEDVAKVLNN